MKESKYLDHYRIQREMRDKATAGEQIAMVIVVSLFLVLVSHLTERDTYAGGSNEISIRD